MTLEQFEDQATQALLGILPENEQREFTTYLRSASNEEKHAFSALRKSVMELPLAPEAQEPSADAKNALFAKLEKTERPKQAAPALPSNQLVMPAFRYAASLVAMFVIGFLFSLSFFSSPQTPNSGASENAAQLAQLTDVQNIAMCTHVEENILNVAENTPAGGKLYLNRKKDAVVLHICALPKLNKDEHYTLWLVKPSGEAIALKDLYHTDPLTEQNYTFSGLNLAEVANFQLTRETTETPTAPSADVLLRS